MKKNWPYQILLGLTLVTTGFMVLYNLCLRDSYAVTVRYDFPSVHRAGEPAEPAEAIQEDTADADLFQDEDTDFTEDSALYDAYFAEEEQDVVSVTFPLDLNTATVDELKFIPQVGDVTAQRIIQYRDHLGGYTQLEQLMEIKGIAEKFFERIEPYLYIGDNDNLEE